MERIVYLLGAGFSAPLGLPVMKDFISKSKDMASSGKSGNYSYFENIFKMIKDISYLKSFINSDLFNIEEILSVLEMGYFVGDKTINIEDFKKYIKDVITFNTPAIDFNQKDLMVSNWNNFIFGHDKKLNLYGLFVLNLFQLRIEKTKQNVSGEMKMEFETKQIIRKDNVVRRYDIITLNYDECIEKFIKLINNVYTSTSELDLGVTRDSSDESLNNIKYSKLHGSVSKEIILPTWNKNISQPIVSNWELAYNILKEANEVRIVGYSLPLSDNYIKYLLANAFIDSGNLKYIDVITLDSDGETRKRYEHLFTFHNFNFKNSNFLDFLCSLMPIKLSETPGSDKSFIEFYSDIFEKKHREFMPE